MTLSHTTTHISQEGFAVSDMTITVEWNETEQEVERIKSINSFNYHTGHTTAIDPHFNDHYPEAMDCLVDSIDWAKIAGEEEQIELENSAPVTSY